MELVLQTLRELIGDTRHTKRDHFPCSLVSSGIPKAAITEVCGLGKTSFVVRFLAENPTLKASWIEDDFSIYPCGFLQNSVHLDRVLFTESRGQSLWAALQVLRSGLFQIVVIAAKPPQNEKILRRLQLASEKAGASVILLSEEPSKAWPIAFQLQVLKSGGLFSQLISVVKLR